MISSFALTPEIRVQLEAARRDLNLSQADLSDMAGMSQGAVSNCLQGKVVRVESLHRLLSAFAAAVASAPERGVSTERAADLQKVIEAARRSVDGSSESAGYLARPGGPMPEEAANRIRRPEDQQLLAALADAPFTAAVTGPPECGKSTLLQLLAAEARRRGFAVAEFDAAMVAPSGTEISDAERLSDAFFRELAEEVGRTIGERPEVKERWTRFDLLRFLKDTRLRRPAPPLLLVVDHASRIQPAIEELIQVCRSLDAQKGRTQMSWAIEISDLPVGDPAVGVLSRLAPSPQVALGFLAQPQVQEIAALYDLRDEGRVRELWNWFSGQPFLTHAALTRWRDSLLSATTSDMDDAWRAVVQEVDSAAFEFGRHLSRVKSRFRFYWRQEGAIGAEPQRDPSFMNLLAAFGMIDSSGRLVNFYRHHLAKL